MAPNVFAISLNSYTWGRFDLAECLGQIKQTPLRRIELPVEQTRPKSLIPELMVDAPLHGQWQYSLPDLRALLAADGFVVDSLAVFGVLGYPGGADIIKVEAPEGDALRRWSASGAEFDGDGALFSFLAGGKRSVVVDLSEIGDVERLAAAAAARDAGRRQGQGSRGQAKGRSCRPRGRRPRSIDFGYARLIRLSA